jgi:F-type H+-transporting ATPase subunit delta
MKSSKQSKREAKELFRACVKDGLLDEAKVRSVVQQVLATKPRGYLAILGHFQRLVKLDLDRREARVETATPAAPELETSVRNRLTQVYGKGLNITFAHNPSLIGGMRIKVGSDVYDGSVQAKLNALQESF